MNVYQKLQQARISLQNTKLAKSRHNKFAGYMYFELGDFLPTTQSLFNDIGLCGTVCFTSDLATLSIFNIDKPEQVILFTSPMGSAALKGCHEVQNIGAVETYQRRYLWVVAMEIVEHDALDATTKIEDKVKTPNHKPVPVDVFKSLPVDVQTYLQDEAMNIISYLSKDKNDDGYDYLESLELDADSKTGMWSLLDSKQRSAIKKVAESRRI